MRTSLLKILLLTKSFYYFTNKIKKSMKLFKLTAAALALVAFASCSNDELFSSNEQNKNITSVLIADVETPDGIVTRAARNANAGGFTWQKEDKIRVYDTDLAVYDTYEYGESFGREGDTRLTKAPAFALYPAENIKKGYWDPTDGHVAEVVIPNIIEYNKTKGAEQTLADGTVVYQMPVPMWGTAAKKDEATVEVTGNGMQPLTGVLYMTLTNALGNASWIKLESATKNLSGRFIAKLDDAEPKLIESDDDIYKSTFKKTIYVDMRNLPSDKAVLYLPVIAGVSDLIISRSADTSDDPTTIGTWTTVSNLDTYTFARNRYKKVGFDYDLAANTPSAISAALAQFNEQSTDVTLNVVQNLLMNQTLAPTVADKVIEIPAMAASVVTINLRNDVTAAATPEELTLQDADSEAPFTGTLILNASKADGTASLADASKLPVTINLPKAKVVLVGDYTGTSASTIKLTAADEIQFGDGSINTKIGGAAALDINNVAKEFTIANKAVVSAELTVSTNTSALKTINIKGQAADVKVKNSPATINITGAGKVTGNIETKGDVNINLTNEGIAVANDKSIKLYLPTTVTITQGYVGTITNDFSALGEADAKEAKVVFPAGEGLTAIKAINVSGDGCKITPSTSKWNGKLPTATTIASFIDATSKVYTAAQLTTFMGTDAETIDIQNDIDLNNDPEGKWLQPINGKSTGLTINGNKHTISNINLNNFPDEKYQSDHGMSIAGVGFIGKAAGDLTVTNLTLKDVKFTKDYNNQQAGKAKTFKVAGVGGLAGEVAGDISLNGVTVTLADNFGYSSYTAKSGQTVEVDATKVGVGGLVGIAAGNADLKTVVVNGALIQGYTSLGGFIGVTTGNIDIDKNCKSNITAFKSNYSDPSATNIEMNYGRIGGAVGYVAAASNVTIKYGATTNDVVATLPAGAEGELYVSVSAGTGNKLWSWSRNQQWIGFSASEAAPGTGIGTVTIGKTSSTNYNYVTPTFKADGTLNDLATGATALYTWTAKAN